jgi:D-serine deaminase-like pyridoxal phosphate-dependent protein
MVQPPSTPFLRVDVGRLEANLARTAAAAADAGVTLRPHAKTHKCPEIARPQLALGAVGLTVATLGEAEVLVEHGCTDVFVAYPVWLDDDRAHRLRTLTEQATVAVGIDSASSAARLGDLVPGLAVLVEVDSGQHRTGSGKRYSEQYSKRMYE